MLHITSSKFDVCNAFRSEATVHFLSQHYAVEMTVDMGFPLGMGNLWKSHGNGTNIKSVVGMGMGMGRDLDGNGNISHSHGK